ncbi:MAG TPA: septum formation protein Maf [Rhodobacteraceae bacterium]|nr:septum formation protein Maf [Paracoccaceae bacterium]
MVKPLILASGSAIRAEMLRNAAVPFEIEHPRVDEATVKSAMISEGAPPRDIADALAQMKARKIAGRRPEALVMGCDQVLEFGGTLISKPADPGAALAQLQAMRGQRHMLLSAALIYENAEPVWRHVGLVRLQMREASDAYLRDYVARNWDSIRHSVGAYKLEEEGVRLFTRIDGDYFTVLGMPLLQVLNYLTGRGVLQQ